MKSISDKPEITDWVNKTLAQSVHTLAARNVIESQIAEAKPSWIFPFSIMIGKVRTSTSHTQTIWFANSNELVHFAAEDVALTPREAARHFALKWQLDAQRLYDNDTVDNVLADSLVAQSTSLLELVEQDSLWAA
ncbi:hypothetical protein GCM10008090_21400 [Arenicella chitinivorans]|uniref:DUF4826 family protein n=1 Tax=Arenicella chitinivorans TaxID=1329800 RepID=A0A918RSP6_9GAMM|nr:DUF4826 family protein [Arenicella chitinivorans]GHA11357.1 hypothetical protein GCM10008090_21400 [Arenicella chitinivorans]